MPTTCVQNTNEIDPFGDFEARGYLRNKGALRDRNAVKEAEYRVFRAKLRGAFNSLGRVERVTYEGILDTHKLLFQDFYPWAGQDRNETSPNLAINRGPVFFANPNDIRMAGDHALRLAQDQNLMGERPGEIMGYLAYAHPFLDGNGRTLLVVHTELAERAGISVDWGATDKTEYLVALTRELDSPGKGHLDAYLKPFVGSFVGRQGLAGHIVRARPGRQRWFIKRVRPARR